MTKAKVDKKAVMIDNIHKLPLSVFVDCVVRQDFIGLCVSGIPTVDQFHEAWDKIYFDYLDAVGGNEFKDETEKLATWALKQSRLVRFEQLIRALEKFPCEGLYNMLFDFRYDVEKKPYTEENLAAAITAIMPYFKLDKTRLEIEIAEQQDGVKSETVPYTDEYFSSLLIEIGTAFNMDINEQNLMLGKFCSYIKKYKAKLAALEKEILKNAIN